MHLNCSTNAVFPYVEGVSNSRCYMALALLLFHRKYNIEADKGQGLPRCVKTTSSYLERLPPEPCIDKTQPRTASYSHSEMVTNKSTSSGKSPESADTSAKDGYSWLHSLISRRGALSDLIPMMKSSPMFWVFAGFAPSFLYWTPEIGRCL